MSISWGDDDEGVKEGDKKVQGNVPEMTNKEDEGVQGGRYRALLSISRPTH